jgi:hypothetical protein
VLSRWQEDDNMVSTAGSGQGDEGEGLTDEGMRSVRNGNQLSSLIQE